LTAEYAEIVEKIILDSASTIVDILRTLMSDQQVLLSANSAFLGGEKVLN